MATKLCGYQRCAENLLQFPGLCPQLLFDGGGPDTRRVLLGLGGVPPRPRGGFFIISSGRRGGCRWSISVAHAWAQMSSMAIAPNSKPLPARVLTGAYIGRTDKIRTCDLYHPKVAREQAVSKVKDLR